MRYILTALRPGNPIWRHGTWSVLVQTISWINVGVLSCLQCGGHFIESLQNLQSLRWRHNEWDGVSNHQPQDCLLNRLSGPRSKKTSKPRVTGLCAGIHRGPVNSPHKWPVTRKLFPFGDVIMFRNDYWILWYLTRQNKSHVETSNTDNIFTGIRCIPPHLK